MVDAKVALGERRIQVGFIREYDPAHVQLAEALGEMGRLDAWRSVHRNVNPPRHGRPSGSSASPSCTTSHSVHFLTAHASRRCTVPVAVRSATRSGTSPSCAAPTPGLQAIIEFDDCGFAYEVLVDVLGEHGDAATGAPLRAVRRRNGAVETVIGPDWFAYFTDRVPHPGPGMGRLRPRRPGRRTEHLGRLPVTGSRRCGARVLHDRPDRAGAGVRPAIYG